MIEITLMNGEKIWINPHAVCGMEWNSDTDVCILWFGSPKIESGLGVKEDFNDLKNRINDKL